MTDPDQLRPGGCAAPRCPLLGTRYDGGRWVCFCHADKPAATHEHITEILLGPESHIVDAALQVRAGVSFSTKPEAYRALKQRFVEAGDEALLPNDSDKQTGGARAWLMRLERHLSNAVADIGRQQRLFGGVPSAPIIGPTHVGGYVPKEHDE